MGRYLQTFSKVPVPGPQFSYLPPWSVNGRVSASISLPKSNFRHSFVFFVFFFHSLPVSIVPISHHPSVFFFKITANEPLFLLLVKKKTRFILAVIIFVSLTNKQEKRIKNSVNFFFYFYMSDSRPKWSQWERLEKKKKKIFSFLHPPRKKFSPQFKGEKKEQVEDGHSVNAH